MEVRPLVRDAMDDGGLAQLAELLNLVDPDQLPGDPPINPALAYDKLSPGSAKYHFWSWGLFEHGELLAAAQAHGSALENTDIADLGIGVHPAHRRQGLATTLLDHVGRELAGLGRTRLFAWGGIDDATRGFWQQRVGKELAFDERISRCVLANVDPDLMQRWIDRAQERAHGYHLERWQGLCPEHLVVQFCRAREAMNDAPQESLEVEDALFDAERLRDSERLRVDLGLESWAIMAVETATGQAGGYTGITIPRSRPELSNQSDTVTLADHRNRGIGRWMKAEMWQWLRRDRPDVVSLDTGNAESNEAMLNINVAMGFAESLHIGIWQ